MSITFIKIRDAAADLFLLNATLPNENCGYDNEYYHDILFKIQGKSFLISEYDEELDQWTTKPIEGISDVGIRIKGNYIKFAAIGVDPEKVHSGDDETLLSLMKTSVQEEISNVD